jgi:uncharacterized membrane protein YhhN
MELEWDSVLNLGAFGASIIEAFSILFFFNSGTIDSFWLSVMLILLVLSIIVFLGSWRSLEKSRRGIG